MGKALSMLHEGARPETHAVEKRGVEELGRGGAKVRGERSLEGSEKVQAKTGVECDGFHSKVPLDLEGESRGEVVEFLEKVGQCWRWPQQACTTMFFLIPKCRERASHCADDYDDSLVGSPACARGCELATEMPC